MTMVSQTLIDYRSLGGHFTAEMVELKADFAATSARSLPRYLGSGELIFQRGTLVF